MRPLPRKALASAPCGTEGGAALRQAERAVLCSGSAREPGWCCMGLSEILGCPEARPRPAIATSYRRARRADQCASSVHGEEPRHTAGQFRCVVSAATCSAPAASVSCSSGRRCCVSLGSWRSALCQSARGFPFLWLAVVRKRPVGDLLWCALAKSACPACHRSAMRIT